MGSLNASKAKINIERGYKHTYDTGTYFDPAYFGGLCRHILPSSLSPSQPVIAAEVEGLTVVPGGSIVMPVVVG